MIARALAEPSGNLMAKLIDQLRDAERAREIFRAKGCGASGMSASATAAQVPDATNH